MPAWLCDYLGGIPMGGDEGGEAPEPPPGCDGPVTLTVSLTVGLWASQSGADGAGSDVTVFSTKFEDVTDCKICPTAPQVCCFLVQDANNKQHTIMHAFQFLDDEMALEAERTASQAITVTRIRASKGKEGADENKDPKAAATTPRQGSGRTAWSSASRTPSASASVSASSSSKTPSRSTPKQRSTPANRRRTSRHTSTPASSPARGRTKLRGAASPLAAGAASPSAGRRGPGGSATAARAANRRTQRGNGSNGSPTRTNSPTPRRGKGAAAASNSRSRAAENGRKVPQRAIDTTAAALAESAAAAATAAELQKIQAGDVDAPLSDAAAAAADAPGPPRPVVSSGITAVTPEAALMNGAPPLLSVETAVREMLCAAMGATRTRSSVLAATQAMARLQPPTALAAEEERSKINAELIRIATALDANDGMIAAIKLEYLRELADLVDQMMATFGTDPVAEAIKVPASSANDNVHHHDQAANVQPHDLLLRNVHTEHLMHDVGRETPEIATPPPKAQAGSGTCDGNGGAEARFDKTYTHQLNAEANQRVLHPSPGPSHAEGGNVAAIGESIENSLIGSEASQLLLNGATASGATSDTVVPPQKPPRRAGSRAGKAASGKTPQKYLHRRLQDEAAAAAGAAGTAGLESQTGRACTVTIGEEAEAAEDVADAGGSGAIDVGVDGGASDVGADGETRRASPPAVAPSKSTAPLRLDRVGSKLAVLSGCTVDLIAHMLEDMSTKYTVLEHYASDDSLRERVEKRVATSKRAVFQELDVDKQGTPAFGDVFLLMFRTFMRPVELLDRLEAAVGSATTRRSVLLVLRHWATHYWIDFEDNEELHSRLWKIAAHESPSGSRRGITTPDVHKPAVTAISALLTTTPARQTLAWASSEVEQLCKELRYTIQTQNDVFVFDLPAAPMQTYGPTDGVVGQLKSKVLAEQLAIYNHRLLSSVNPVEYVFYHFQNSRPGGIERSPNLGAAIKRFNEESHWVAAEIALAAKTKDQAALIGKFIRTADHSVHLGNFFSLFAILGALCFPSVTRLRAAWEKVPDKLKRLQSDLESLMNPSRNMKAYRGKLKEVPADQMRVPCLPLHLKDILFAGEAGQTVEGAAVNIEKLTMVARCIVPLVVSPTSALLRADHALQAYIQVSTVDPEAAAPVSTGIPNSPATSRRNILKAVKVLLKTSYASEHSRQAEVNESLVGGGVDFSLDLSSVRKRRFPFTRKPDLFPFGKKLVAGDAAGPASASRSSSATARQNAERRRKFLIRKLTSPTKSPATRTRDTESVVLASSDDENGGAAHGARAVSKMRLGSEVESDVETEDESPSMVCARSASEPGTRPNYWSDQSIAELSESPGPAGSRGSAGGFNTPRLGHFMPAGEGGPRPSPLVPKFRGDDLASSTPATVAAATASPLAAAPAGLFNSSFLRAVAASSEPQKAPPTPLQQQNKLAATDPSAGFSALSSAVVSKPLSPAAARTSTPLPLPLAAAPPPATSHAQPFGVSALEVVTHGSNGPINAAEWSQAVKQFERAGCGDNSILETSYIEINDSVIRSNGFTFSEA